MTKNSDPFFEREARKYTNPVPSREFIIKHLEDLGHPATCVDLTKSFALYDEERQKLCDVG